MDTLVQIANRIKNPDGSSHLGSTAEVTNAGGLDSGIALSCEENLQWSTGTDIHLGALEAEATTDCVDTVMDSSVGVPKDAAASIRKTGKETDEVALLPLPASDLLRNPAAVISTDTNSDAGALSALPTRDFSDVTVKSMDSDTNIHAALPQISTEHPPGDDDSVGMNTDTPASVPVCTGALPEISATDSVTTAQCSETLGRA